MANFPIPIGVDRMLLDIAEGIGGAAKILPDASRSSVGAIALKRASVEIAFELSSAARREDGSVGLGAKTFLFGIGTSGSTTEALARNHGRIELEIVAITEPGSADTTASNGSPDGNSPKTGPTAPQLDPVAIRTAIATMRAELRRLPLSDSELSRLERELDRALERLAKGDLDAAGEGLKRIQEALRAMTNLPGTNARGNEQ